jgi:hypothetical protein
MLNKNDPLIGVVQEVMKKNQAERDATKLVNEKFGVTDRKALPHEKQGEWDAVYKSVLTEGVESLDEANFPGAPSVKMPRSMAGDKHTKMYGDLHSKLKSLADSGKINTPEGRKEASGHIDAIQNLVDKHLPGNPVPSKKTWLSEDQLEEKKLIGNQPNIDVASADGKKKPDGKLTRHDFDHLRSKKKPMQENDTTSPSAMGIKKPDYATGTPDYAKSKEQTVNRAAKSSLPAGTVAKNIKEATLDYVRGQTQYGANRVQTTYGANPTQRPYNAGNPNNATGAYASIQGDADRQSMDKMAAARSSTQATISAPNPQDRINAIRRPAAKPPIGTNAAGQQVGAPAAAKPAARTNPGIAKLNAATSAAAKQNPTVSGTRFGGASTYQAKTAAAAKPAAPGSAPATAAKTKGSSTAKPVAKKVTPVRKAAPAPAAAKAKGTPVTRMRQQRQRDKNNVVGPGAGN